MRLILLSVVFCIWAAVSSAFAEGLFTALPDKPPVPANNPQTSAKIQLGKKLYFDPRLSKDGTLSCNSCHNVMAGGDDGRPTSAGVGGKLGKRNSPTVWNAAFLSVQFWDGREPDLEGQAKGPLINPVEMAMPDHAAVERRVAAIPGYVEEFKKVFGGDKAIQIDNIAKAIASYERTLITPDSPFDRYLAGDKKALSASAQRGFQLFQSVGCVSCHMGPAFSGPPLPVGTGFFQKFPMFPDQNEYIAKYKLGEDQGRYEATKKDEDRHFFRVPTLRNVAVTAPYFHNGAVNALADAVRVMARSQLNKSLSDAEVSDLVSFLSSLTGKFPKQELPRLPETVGTSLVGG